MDISLNIDIIRKTRWVLENNPSDEEFRSNLSDLGAVVTQTAQDEQTRNLISGSLELWNEVLSCYMNPNPVWGSEYWCRTFRGVLLLTRNLVSSQSAGELFTLEIGCDGVPINGPNGPNFIKLNIPSQQWDNYNKPNNVNSFGGILLSTIISSLSKIEFEQLALQLPMMEAFLQTLANISQAQAQLESVLANIPSEIVVELLTIITKNLQLIKSSTNLKLAIFIIVDNFMITQASTIPQLITQNSSLMNYMIDTFHHVDTDAKLTRENRLLLTILQKLVSHESYSTYLKNLYHEQQQQQDVNQWGLITTTFQTGQLIVTSKDDWDEYEIVAMLAWLFEFLKEFSTKAREILPAKNYDTKELSFIHINLVAVLDCISELGKFETTRQFLINYNVLSELIPLLKMVHENIPRQTMKNRPKIEQLDDTTSVKKFPQVKSLIIEVIAFLAHGNRQIQDQVYNLGGLGLILSNCMIDENDPFIKERAIICIKILLDQNETNQNYVAQLEAKQTVDDSALQEIGYEVEIVDGKVGLRKKETLRNNHPN